MAAARCRDVDVVSTRREKGGGRVTGKTLLVALSHPDDEVGCAGTIAAHVALGHRVVLLMLTRGEMTESLGPLDATEVARLRTEHGREAAAILGAEIRFLDLPDTRLEVTADAGYAVAAEIADIAPHAVITWGDAWVRGPRHPDHHATGQIVRNAITLARIARVVRPRRPHRELAPVFALRDVHSALPEAAIDVSAQLDRVHAVAGFYRERVGWPRRDWLEARLAAAGARFGVAAAEVFDAWETSGGLRTDLF
jgi:N-acetylglucosamine malate deacetylase 1